MLTDLKTNDQFILSHCVLRCIVIFDREYMKHNHSASMIKQFVSKARGSMNSQIELIKYAQLLWRNSSRGKI